METTALPSSFSWILYDMFSDITNYQYPWKELNGFVDVLHVVMCIWLQKYEIWAGNVRHELSANEIARYFKLKKLENCISFHVEFLHVVR